MVTPFYSDLAALSQSARLAYCFNPFAHVTSLIGGGFEQPRGREVGGLLTVSNYPITQKSLACIV